MVSTADSLADLLEREQKSVLVLDADIPSNLTLHESLQAVWDRMEKDHQDVMVFQYPYIAVGSGFIERGRESEFAMVVNWRHVRHVLYGLEPSPAVVDVIVCRPDEVVGQYDSRQVFVAWRTQRPPGFVYKPPTKERPEVRGASVYDDQRKYYDGDLDTFVRERGQARYAVVNQMLERFRTKAVHLLSVGCGIGTLEHELAAHFDVVGIDLSPKLVEYARKNHRGRYEVRNAVTDGLADLGSFAVIVLCDSLEHIRPEDRAVLLKNLAKVMENRCIIAVSFPDGDYLRWLRETQPETLQPVDEPVSRYWLTNALGALGFALGEAAMTDGTKAWAMVYQRGW